MSTAFQYDVFISYSRKDKEIAETVFDTLQKAGINAFIDKGIVGGKDFLSEIANKIDASKLFLFLASKNLYEAHYAPDEVAYAKSHKPRETIYCYFIDDSVLPKMFDFAFAAINQRKMSDTPLNSAFVEEIRELLGKELPSHLKPSLISGEVFPVGIKDLSFDMVRVEGGQMMIGATTEQESDAESNEFPPHLVSLPTFYIGKVLVTQDLWEDVMGYNKSHFHKGDPRFPAESLSFDEATEFACRLSKMTNIQFSLPTEEEWEYAARGGQKSQGFRYAGSDNLDEVAWYRKNSGRHTHPVGEKKPNELGLYDMCGNVWEWTQTPAHSYATNIEIGGNMIIRRGGSWCHEAKNCRVSHRHVSDHTKKTSGLGLRVAIRENVMQ